MKLSKRQSIRKGMIIFMCFTFPITIAWLSPAIPVLYSSTSIYFSEKYVIFE